MADHHDEEAACPKCGGTITFTLWENLVAEKYPEAAEKLMRGELFAYECPHCHATGNGYYPLRFTDMTSKVMVDYPATYRPARRGRDGERIQGEAEALCRDGLPA